MIRSGVTSFCIGNDKGMGNGSLIIFKEIVSNDDLITLTGFYSLEVISKN